VSPGEVMVMPGGKPVAILMFDELMPTSSIPTPAS
jgi:hypothetical protein